MEIAAKSIILHSLRAAPVCGGLHGICACDLVAEPE